MGKINKLTIVLFALVGVLLVGVVVVGVIKVTGKGKEPSKDPGKTQEETPDKPQETDKPKDTEPDTTEPKTEKPTEKGRTELYVEDFEDEHHGMTGRQTQNGEILEIIDAYTEADVNGRYLKVSNRTSNWMGATWNSQNTIQGGNTIYASALVKYEVENDDFNGETLDYDVFELSVEYTLDGQTNWDQITILKQKNHTWGELKGNYTFPEGATGISVYVEAERTEDIYVDNFSVYLEP